MSTEDQVTRATVEGNPIRQDSRHLATGAAKTVGSPSAVLDSLEGAFAPVEEDESQNRPGLRRPQVGAVHAVLGHWTTASCEPITVVMPTGTGKTEAMLALFAAARPERLLVLVPSHVLRSQLATKFESFGVLKEVGVVSEDASCPIVGRIEHRFSSPKAAEGFAEKCNVIVATPSALNASVPEVRAALVGKCSHLFVDEAHHVAASTWRQIRDDFSQKQVVQFTATPFREDGRPLGGRILYNFPLREAQAQGYFSLINYLSVVDFADPDRAVAEKALARLNKDLHSELDHILMARVKRIGRVPEVAKLYKELAPDLNPVILHSSLSATDRRAALQSVRDRTSRIIICVDMLGEGFDLPALKVAAIHDPHKSLGVTLQFIGRFARGTEAAIGDATVVLQRPDPSYDERLRDLYAEDANWNLIIRDLSETAVEEEEAIGDFEAGFTSLPEEVSLRNIVPKMSTVVYQTNCDSWDPHSSLKLYPKEQLLTETIAVNEAERVAWFVTENRNPVRWGNLRSIEEVGYDLYVLYWNSTDQLLYINSSNNESVHEILAKAVCGDDTTRITGENVYRIMAGVKRLVPTTVGVLDVRNAGRRFSMHVGADVSEGFPVAEAQTKTKTNIFANGYEDGTRISVGASLKGRVWSYRVAPTLKHWVDWCDNVGKKLTDSNISVDDVMRDFIRPQAVENRPSLIPLGLEWPWELFQSTTEGLEVDYKGSLWPLVDTDLEIAQFSTTGPIPFDVVTRDWQVRYSAEISGGSISFKATGDEIDIVTTRTRVPLSAFLAEYGLTFLFEQDAMIVPPGMLLRPERDIPAFDVERLNPLDWSGINLRKESQGAERDPTSIQAHTIAHLRTLTDWDVVIDDDGTGEIADVVAIRQDGRDLDVYLAHCKYSSRDEPGARIVDLYEVCGQAQKSVRWRRNVPLFFQHLIRRERHRFARHGRSGFVVGDASALYELEDKSRFLRPAFTIGVIQPGVSKARVSGQQLDLLASTDVYVYETSYGRFEVICSP